MGRLERLRASSFARATGVLVAGTLIGQGLGVLALLWIARLYTPTDFAVLAVFGSVVTVLGAIACLRLDVVIPLPESDDDAAHVLLGALGSAVLIGGLTSLPLLLAPEPIAHALGQPALVPHLWLVPMAVLLVGGQSALQLWSVRRKAFVPIAASRVLQAATGSGVQLGLGWSGAGPIGLLLGQVVNFATSCIALGGHLLRRDIELLHAVRRPRLRELLHRYRRYPTFSTLESLANTLSLFLPIILISALVGGPDVGYVNLAMYVMAAPMSLIGTAVSQVYVSRAPDENRAGLLGPFTTRVLGSLMRTGIGPLVFAGIVAPTAFPAVFGAQWQRSGDLVAWMTPWFALQFLAAPLSMALHVKERPAAAAALQLVGLLVRVGAVIAAAWHAPAFAAETYALSGLLYYAIYLVALLRTVGAQANDVGRELLASVPLLGAWIAAGVGVNIAAGPILEWLQ